MFCLFQGLIFLELCETYVKISIGRELSFTGFHPPKILAWKWNSADFL